MVSGPVPPPPQHHFVGSQNTRVTPSSLTASSSKAFLPTHVSWMLSKAFWLCKLKISRYIRLPFSSTLLVSFKFKVTTSWSIPCIVGKLGPNGSATITFKCSMFIQCKWYVKFLFLHALYVEWLYMHIFIEDICYNIKVPKICTPSLNIHNPCKHG